MFYILFYQIRRGEQSGPLLTNSQGKKLSQTAQYLSNFSQKHIQKDFYLTPTILRQMVETRGSAQLSTSQMEEIRRYDSHSSQVAERYYLYIV